MISKEAKREYDKKRYFNGLKQSIFGERRCGACSIFLKSKFGAYKTRRFCRSCRDNGSAQRVLNREFYLNNRERVLARVKSYASR